MEVFKFEDTQSSICVYSEDTVVFAVYIFVICALCRKVIISYMLLPHESFYVIQNSLPFSH